MVAADAARDSNIILPGIRYRHVRGQLLEAKKPYPGQLGFHYPSYGITTTENVLQLAVSGPRGTHI